MATVFSQYCPRHHGFFKKKIFFFVKLKQIFFNFNTRKMTFLTEVACEIGRNRYFAGTDPKTGSDCQGGLWVFCH